MVIHTDKRLQTPRLTLQAFRDEDLAAACMLLSSAEVAKTYMLPDFRSTDEAAGLFRRLKELSESEEHFVRGIYLHETLIGFLNDVEIEEDSIELGYVIAPAHWGNGCATEALAAAIDALCGRSRSLNTVHIECDREDVRLHPHGKEFKIAADLC